VVVIAAALVACTLVAPAATVAAFDDDGQGFIQARHHPRTSITVEEPRTDVGFSIAEAIAPWNELAGWPLFVVSDADVTNVRVWANWPADDPHRAAVYVTPDGDGAYLRCEIRYDPTDELDVDLFSHELGHCLGLLDHETCAGYQGIMSYCGDTYEWGPDDAATLEHYGYA
jgi:hypothetical protein